MEEQHLYIVCILTGFLLYTYIFGKHDSIVNVVLSLGILGCFYNLFKYYTQHLKDVNANVSEKTNWTKLKSDLDIEKNIKWVEYDETFSSIFHVLYPVTRFDKEILRNTILQANKFLKTFYTALSNEHSLYKNIKKNQIVIQELEDIRLYMIDQMKDLIYVISTKYYYKKYDIPSLIGMITEYMEQKIILLSSKFKMKPSKLFMG